MPFIIPSLTFSIIFGIIFLIIVVFYSKPDKEKVIRALYLYATTIASLVVFLAGFFIVAQTVLNQTILPSSEPENYFHEFSQAPVRIVDKAGRVTFEGEDIQQESRTEQIQEAQERLKPAIDERREIIRKNVLRSKMNTSAAMLLVGGLLLWYQRRFLKKI